MSNVVAKSSKQTFPEYAIDVVKAIARYIKDISSSEVVLAKPEWFDSLDCRSYPGMNMVWNDEIDDLLREKRVYDERRWGVLPTFGKEKVEKPVVEKGEGKSRKRDHATDDSTVEFDIDHATDSNPIDIAIGHESDSDLEYEEEYSDTDSQTHTYPEILQLLADEINKLHHGVKQATDKILTDSENLIKYFTDNGNTASFDDLSGELGDYFDDVIHDSRAYSEFYQTAFQLGYEITRSHPIDELLESSYYARAYEYDCEGWYGADYDLERIIDSYETDLEEDFPEYARVTTPIRREYDNEC